MNRRSFLAGLLATTAAVPLAKAAPFTGSMDSAGVDYAAALDLAGGPDQTWLWFVETAPPSFFIFPPLDDGAMVPATTEAPQHEPTGRSDPHP